MILVDSQINMTQPAASPHPPAAPGVLRRLLPLAIAAGLGAGVPGIAFLPQILDAVRPAATPADIPVGNTQRPNYRIETHIIPPQHDAPPAPAARR